MIHPSAQKIINAIDEFWFEKRYAPSLQDIESITGISSKSNVLYHLRNLKEAGFIVFDEGVARSARTKSFDHILRRAIDPEYVQEE